MGRLETKRRRRVRRDMGTRKRILGTPERPRLTVFRSLKHVYAQIIDDLSGRTLAAASSLSAKGQPGAGGNCRAAAEVGRALAENAGSAGVRQVVFARNGFRYHGRVKALADAAREGGLNF